MYSNIIAHTWEKLSLKLPTFNKDSKHLYITNYELQSWKQLFSTTMIENKRQWFRLKEQLSYLSSPSIDNITTLFSYKEALQKYATKI